MESHSSSSTDRRSFLSRLTAAISLAAFGVAASPAQSSAATGPWDLSWLDGLKGKHKQIFSAGVLQDGVVLDIATNWLDAHQEVFGLRHPDVNAVIGIANKSIAINLSDAMWKK